MAYCIELSYTLAGGNTSDRCRLKASSGKVIQLTLNGKTKWHGMRYVIVTEDFKPGPGVQCTARGPESDPPGVSIRPAKPC